MRTIRATGTTVPIIAVSSRVMPGDKEHALAAGCDHFMAKPIDDLALVEMVGDPRAAMIDRSDLPAGRPARILIVDDEPLNVDYLEQELEGRGFEIETAVNGLEAPNESRPRRPTSCCST